MIKPLPFHSFCLATRACNISILLQFNIGACGVRVRHFRICCERNSLKKFQESQTFSSRSQIPDRGGP